MNLTSMLICTQPALPGMIEPRRGTFVNVASLAAKRGGGILGKVAYATAKAGVLGFTKCVARETADVGIRANAVAPGAINTGMATVLAENDELALNHVSLANVVEFRVMIESWAVRSVAERRDEPLLAHLESLLVEEPDPLEFHALDAAFHGALVKGASNELVDLVVAATNGAISKFIKGRAAVSWDWKSSAARLFDEHRRIYDAIAAGDGDRAAELMTEHIRYWGDRIVHSSVTPGTSAVID